MYCNLDLMQQEQTEIRILLQATDLGSYFKMSTVVDKLVQFRLYKDTPLLQIKSKKISSMGIVKVPLKPQNIDYFNKEQIYEAQVYYKDSLLSTFFSKEKGLIQFNFTQNYLQIQKGLDQSSPFAYNIYLPLKKG